MQHHAYEARALPSSKLRPEPCEISCVMSWLFHPTIPQQKALCQKALSACQALSKTQEECAARSSVLTSGCQLVHDSSSSLRNGRWEDGETAQPLKCLVRKHTCGHEFDFQTSYKKNGYGGKCLESPHPHPTPLVLGRQRQAGSWGSLVSHPNQIGKLWVQ